LKRKYKLKNIDEYDKIKQQLIKKGVLNKNGSKTTKTRKVWEDHMGKKLPSQLHQ
jgi:hypothetical protein